MSQPLLIKIPIEHLPATICSFLVKPGDRITKSQSLLSYEYKKIIHPARGEYVDVLTPQIEELKSPTEGKLEQFHVKPGETIDRKDNRVVVGVIEPCSHSIQLHGLCALCGTDITTKDHNGIEYAQRATISMAHNVIGLTVSLTEAERLERETSNRLLELRKLSLIVDLDQTLIQATIDSTVEEWMRDESSVNHPATKDIHRFTLPDSPIVYYIKLRPGLKEFLRSVSKMYEPHIYTMGTRNYASAVANVIDPDNTIFNERILSRDESGSMTQKNIRRLFPCNDSMVVVIDDRADVWTWSPNLIKVHPYDFFVGIGDINDTYLPKIRQTLSVPVPEITVSEDNNVFIMEEFPEITVSENNIKKEIPETTVMEEIPEITVSKITEITVSEDNIMEEIPETTVLEEIPKITVSEDNIMEEIPEITVSEDNIMEEIPEITVSEDNIKEEITEITVSEDNIMEEILDHSDLNNVKKEKEQVNNASVSENHVSANEDKEPQSNETNSSEVAENSIKNDKVSKDVSISDEKSTKEPLKVNTENNTSMDALSKPVQNNKRSFEEISEDVDNVDEKSAKKQQLDRNENNENKVFNRKFSFVKQEQRIDNSKPILVDNDTELPNLLKALETIHEQYYGEYERMKGTSNSNGTPITPDVTILIPRLKSQVLKGVNILFTHVIPTNQKKENADIWILAREFGAECSASWSNRVTHLVAGDRGTEKVKEARRKGNIFIVRKEWLDESIKKWERQPEQDYVLEPASPRNQIPDVPELIIETPSGNDLTDDDDSLLSPEERREHFESTDWRSALNEVDELLAESGDTSALDESETETESGGRKGLKRYVDVLDVDDRNAKRLKQSPLRQSITFNDNEVENESEQENTDSVKGGITTDFDHDSELVFEEGGSEIAQDDIDIDEVEQDYEDENNDIAYYDEEEDDDYEDDGNQSDDEGGDDDDFDDEEYALLFEEKLKQPNDESQNS